MATRQSSGSAASRLTLSLIGGGGVLAAAAAVFTWQRSGAVLTGALPESVAHGLLIEQIVVQAVLVVSMVALATVLIRRSLAGPLAEVVELVDVGAKPEVFAELADQQRGEFARLSRAMGEALADLDRKSFRVAASEQDAEAEEAIADLTSAVEEVERLRRLMEALPVSATGDAQAAPRS